MAAIVNARDTLLQAAGTRLLPVTLPSNVTYSGNTAGDHTGTLSGQGQTNFQNNQIALSVTGQLLNAGGGALTTLNFVGGNFSGDAAGTFGGTSLSGIRNTSISLSSTGSLNGAGGGQITDLDYGNVSGSKPPSNATSNFFSTSGSNPNGGVNGDAHWNSSTQTMWFKTGGVWRVGGTVNANQITTGVLAAARIAANSITSDKINVGTLSAIAANLGTVNAGNIFGSANINISGSAIFSGFSSSGGLSAAVLANPSGTQGVGVIGKGSSGGTGVRGIGGLVGVRAEASGGSATAISAQASSGAACIVATTGECFFGHINTSSTALVANLHAANSDALGGIDDSGWCRGIVTNSGTATAAGFGFALTSTVSGTRTRAFGGNNIVIEPVSDRRLKIDISPEKLGLDFVNQLKPVRYRFKSNPKIKHHGFIAQDVEKIIGIGNDALAQTHDDGTKGTDYMSMVSVLVKAIQELNEKIEGVMYEKAAA